MRNFRATFSALIFTAAVAGGTACAQGTRVIFPPSTGAIGTAPATAQPSAVSPYGGSAPGFGGSGTLGGGTLSGGVPANSIPGSAGASTLQPPSVYTPPGSYAPPASLGAPSGFDPYSTAPGVPNPWSTAPSASGSVQPSPFGTSPFSASPSTSGGFAPPAGPFSSPGSYPGTPNPYINSGAYPSQSSNSLFPNGFWGNTGGGQPYDYSQTLKLLQDPTLTHTYLGNGSDPTDVNINDTYAWVTFALPNFLGSGQPWYIAPNFGIHLWDGPHSLPADLPPSAYSAFLDTQFSTDPNLQLGAELDFRIGVYTDFHTFNSHSLRIQGMGLGTLKLTPTLTLKLGAKYIDRNDLKILPAGGLLWQPSNRVRFDIFFPQPKLATYLSTINNKDVWWYVRGEYGGGAWTIQRTSGISDRMDINDIRVAVGLETMGPGCNLFAEAGYVFDRHVVYVVTPSDSFDPGNTFMFRAGFSF